MAFFTVISALLSRFQMCNAEKMLIYNVLRNRVLKYFFNKKRKKTLSVWEKVVFLHSDLRKKELFERLNKADVTQLVE